MQNRTIIETACAIRMNGMRALRSCSGDPAPVVVTCTGESILPPDVVSGADRSWGAALTFGAGATPAQIGEAVAAHVAKTGTLPSIIDSADAGVFFVDSSLAMNRWKAATMGRPDPDKIRPAVKPRAGRLAGRVAVVTGSAQGFGRGIAEELVREGACIVVADLNDELGRRAASELNAIAGCEAALFCHADVTSADSMDALCEGAVFTFGGLDIFVANAGVLIAGGIDEMQEKAFDLVTGVNYKGFFLGARSAARVMRLQHRFDPDHAMDIVQISSKSGLQGSNRNFAYAGSKFGGIGLVQSFALELVDCRIKVNAICPGNYFEGPLWSDPEKGLFVQYLRAGKVPGASTVDDVKKFYTDKVPMKRGCLPLDVARAIIYLHEQQYETGQALPVTGGQVMLN